MAGFAFSNTKTALAHNISYDITLKRGTPHGIACSFSPADGDAMVDRQRTRNATRSCAGFSAPTSTPASEQAESVLIESLGCHTEPSAYGV